MVKKGDTLIEVTLAVGIFSMIAIAVVAVLSNSTSNAQTALESTLAREQVDSQTEALRFIQSSYINDKDSKYAKLWEEITNNHSIAVDNSTYTDKIEEILKYTPETCDELYEKEGVNSIYFQKAFVINPSTLGTFDSDNIGDVLYGANEAVFKSASTYPRLIDKDNVNGGFTAEGIYVIAVKDHGTTNIAQGNNSSKTSAFYDFYIRTCWYGSNADKPSAVSTVIRLYNPAITTTTK